MAEAQLTNQLTRIDSMTNVELRAELKKRGCPTSGNKKDLLAKLRAALQKEYEQAAVDVPTNIDPMGLDGRNNQMAGLQQSPVVPFDVNRSMMTNPMVSGNNYMTQNPMAYQQHLHTPEMAMNYNNLQMHDQGTGQYPPVYNLTMHQNIHQNPAPMIPVPQQLPISPAERHQIYDPSLLHSSQHHQIQQIQQQMTPMNTRQGRSSVDDPIVPPISTPSPEKRTRTRAKKPSVDSQVIEQFQAEPEPVPMINPVVNNVPEPTIEPTTSLPATTNVEVNPCVSKSNEEDEKERENQRENRGESRSPSVGSSSAKSESVIKEIPLSGDRNRLSRSKSPKSRWHHSPSPRDHQQQSTIDEENHSAQTTNDDDEQTNKEQIETSSTVVSSAEKANEEHHPVQEQNNSTEQQDSTPKESAQPEKAAPQQQLKPSRSQGSSSSSSLMKGLHRPTSNRMNLSSDVLKTLIPNISLAPESVIDSELEASSNEQNNDDDGENSPNSTMLETNAPSGSLFSDSMTIGDLADQKQQRNRTVVIDVAVDSSSLNDDLLGNNGEVRKKVAPTRMASYESKTLLDGKTNALMMDEPVRVKDVTAAREPPTRIVFIRGLTRPFTLTQLKELLSRYGTLIDGEFWLDKIKSQCFVMYNTLEEAQSAREGLDGCRWPSTNPKTLVVRFGRQEEFDFSKTHDLSPDQMPTNATESTDNRLVQEKTISVTRRSASPTDEPKTSNKKTRSTANSDVREWDLPKFQQEKESNNDERQVIEEQTAKTNEPQAKNLDDYFRKTKATPAIYWLPLTDEQIVERMRQDEERKVKREEERRKRQAEDEARASANVKDSKSRSNNNNSNSSSNRPYRRSPSPKEKRKHVSSGSVSPPPVRRDNKRH